LIGSFCAKRKGMPIDNLLLGENHGTVAIVISHRALFDHISGISVFFRTAAAPAATRQKG
jgi:hypothetical protein